MDTASVFCHFSRWKIIVIRRALYKYPSRHLSLSGRSAAVRKLPRWCRARLALLGGRLGRPGVRRRACLELCHRNSHHHPPSVHKPSAPPSPGTVHRPMGGATMPMDGDVNAVDGDGFTAVFAEAQKGHVEAVRALAKLGACVKTAANDGATPVFVAVQEGHVETVRVLAELGACVKTAMNDGATPVFIAAAKGHMETVRLLAKLGACVKTPDSDGATPVFMAVQQGHVGMVRALAELGACVKTPTRIGTTPVCLAALRGRAKVIRLLAILKADITTPGASGLTPLAISTGSAHFEATKTLLLLGAPITIEDLKQRPDSISMNTARRLRADLQTWAADALVQHHIFCSTFLFGCTVHPQETTFKRTTCEIPIPRTAHGMLQSAHGLPPAVTSESAPTRLWCAETGARVVTTTVTTLTATAITSVTTFTRTTNATLPIIGGVPAVHQLDLDEPRRHLPGAIGRGRRLENLQGAWPRVATRPLSCRYHPRGRARRLAQRTK